MTRWCALLAAAAVLLFSLEADAGRRRRRGRRGALALTCPVDGATVTIDGNTAGKTPINQQALGSGTHTVVVKKLGYRVFAEKVRIRPRKTTQLLADLHPSAGVIDVSADVAEAEVSVDGKVIGVAPLEHEIELGRHTITVTAPGYAPFAETISADPGNVYKIVAQLAESDIGAGDLELAALPGSDGLALEPLNDAPEPRDGGLALEPLDNGLALEPLDDLSLTALPGTTQAPDDDSLDLTALAPLPAAAGRPGVGATVEETPWYLEWWAISAAVAVVAGAVATTLVLTGGEDQAAPDRCEGVWEPGEPFRGWTGCN